ncbi:MAG: hypothetical protein U1A78_19955 [Polyangia bacterium]
MVSSGAHRAQVVTDLVLVQVVGVLERAQAQALYDCLDRVLAEQGYCLALFDLTQASLPSAESRKWISRWFTERDLRVLAVATFGTGLLVRTINRMFDGAVAVLSGRAAPTRHFSDAETARRWLDEMRPQLGARIGR